MVSALVLGDMGKKPPSSLMLSIIFHLSVSMLLLTFSPFCDSTREMLLMANDSKDCQSKNVGIW